MRRWGVFITATLLFLSLSGCSPADRDATGTSSTTVTTASSPSIREQKAFYEWTLSDMIVYLTEEGVLTDPSRLTIRSEEDLAGTGVSGALTYATEDSAISLDILFWDSQSTDEAVIQQRIDMLAGRPLSLGGLSLTGDRRVGDFLFLYGTSANTAFAEKVAAACDTLAEEM